MVALYENVCTWEIWIYSNKLPIDPEFHSKDSTLKVQSQWIWFQVHSLGVVFLSACPQPYRSKFHKNQQNQGEGL